MDIKSAEQSFQNVTFGEESFNQLIADISRSETKDDYHLSLFIGNADEKKDEGVQKLEEASNRQTTTVDANDIITKIESDTFDNIDKLFEKYDAENSILHLKNGSRLCGVYTGYTHSKVKYATPQERYFLKKIQQSGGFFIVDLSAPSDADTTLKRAAQSIVNFIQPESTFQTLLRKLKGITMHGYQIKTERPKHYGNTAGNF